MAKQESGSIPLVASFAVGHLFNTVSFFLLQEWFSARLDSDHEAGPLARALARRAQSLRTTAESRAAIMAFVRDAIGALERMMGQEWHHEALIALAEQINDPNLPAGEDFDREATRIEDCELFAAPVRDKLGEIRQALTDGLGMRERLAFELGEVVDRGLRRPAIDGRFIRYVPAPMRGTRATYRIAPGYEQQAPAGTDWLRDVEQIARELGIGGDLSEGPEIRSGPEPALDSALVGRLEEAIRGALERLDRGATRPGADDLAKAEGRGDRALPDGEGRQDAPLPPGHLGLILVEDRCLARREGREAVVDLAGKWSSWLLLKKLVRTKGDFSPLDQLRTVWVNNPEHLSDEPEDATIINAVSDLRRLIESLGVAIENRRKLGYRLVDDN